METGRRLAEGSTSDAGRPRVARNTGRGYASCMKHTPSELVESTPELTRRVEAFRAEHAGDALGGVASTVIFEDDRVRIWEMKLEPGEASDWHQHGHDYYLAILTGDLVAGVSKDGFQVFRIPAGGNTVGVAHGSMEWALNVGQTTYREILFELKDTGPGQPGGG